MRIRRSILSFLFLLTAGLFSAPAASAQLETSSVAGTVTDSTGAVIPGANITVRNVDTGLVRTEKANGAGIYAVVDLPPGNYTVVVTNASFGRFEETTVLSVGLRTTVNPKLGASTSSVVEISADSAVATLNTTSNEITQTITPEQIVNLPSLTRNPYDFVAISGNASSDPNGSTGQGVGFSLNGGRSSGTEILLDGVENIDLYTQTVGQTIPLDAVQEYSIVTSGFDARYGRATGGVVNLTTKSGTNKFHGSAYEYNRINALAANTYYEDAVVASGAQTAAQVADHFVRNQFGYSIGGPIFRDKLFFFSSTEWERVRSSASRTYVVPTASFLASSAQSTQAFFQAYGVLRPGISNVGTPITVSGKNKQGTAVSFVNALQQVSFTGPAATVAGSPQNTYFTVDRVDFNLDSKTNGYVRYGLYNQSIFSGASLTLTSPYAGYDTPSTSYDQVYLLSLTRTFKPNLLDTLKLSYTRDNNAQPLGANPAGPTLYTLGGAAKDATTAQYIGLPGYLPLSPGSAIPAGGPENFIQIVNDLEYIRGSHDFHAGGSYEQLRDNRTFGAYENSVNQLSATSEADAFYNLNIGRLYQFQAAIYPQGELPCATSYTTGAVMQTPQCTLNLPLTLPNFERNNTFNDGAAYIQDSYKINHVTVTAGLRWEYFGVQHNHDPNLESNFFLGTGATYQQQFRSGNLLTTPNSPVGGLYAQQFHNFSPRFGLAWDVFGDGKYTLRGGYGLSYERNYGNVTYNVIQNAPAYGVVSLVAKDANSSTVGGTGAGDVGSLPITNSNFGPLAGSSGSKAFPAISLRPVSQNIPTAYGENYNLSLSHEFSRGALVEIAYSGSRGVHLYSLSNVNRLYFGNEYLGDALLGTRLQSQYTAANLRGANGDSHYDSVNLRTELDRFRSSGLHFTLNYTYSHSLDNNSSTFDSGAASGNSTAYLGYLDPFNPSSSYGNSDFDIRQRIAISAIYQPKFFDNHGALLRETLGGLSVAPIITGQSGNAFSVWDNSNTDGQAEPYIANAPGLNYHGSSVFSGTLDKFNYINIPSTARNLGINPINKSSDLPCSPSVQAGCTFNKGMDRNEFYGPGNYSVNLGAYKTFPLYERFKLEVRAEAYDLFNHSNYYVNTGTSAELTSTNAPTGFNLTTSKGGSAGSATNERRQIQLAVRLDF